MSEMFKQYMGLTIDPSPEAMMVSHQMMLETGFYLVNEVHGNIKPEQRTEQVNDALIVFQMVLGKGLAIKKLMEGLDFDNAVNGARMRGLLDPTSIAVLTRTQFEAFANFHNIFNSTDDEELTDLLYNMWVISGLKERQRTVAEDMADEHREKAEHEKEKIERIKEAILNNPYYNSLDSDKQKWFRERIKKRDFELLFKDGEFTKPGWRELFLNAEVNDVFMHLYSIMSLSTHPSNVSVFQYAQMFEKEFNSEMAHTFLSHSTIIMAFMIAEYCKYFELAREKFDELPDMHKMLVDSYNGNYRGRHNEVSGVRDKYMQEFQQEWEKILEQKKEQ